MEDVKLSEFELARTEVELFKVAWFMFGDEVLRTGYIRPSLSELSLRWDNNSG